MIPVKIECIAALANLAVNGKNLSLEAMESNLNMTLTIVFNYSRFKRA